MMIIFILEFIHSDCSILLVIHFQKCIALGYLVGRSSTEVEDNKVLDQVIKLESFFTRVTLGY